jgi:hypothetical protein
MKAADVAMTPACQECGDDWHATDDRRWRACRSDDPFDENDPPAIAFYCPTVRCSRVWRVVTAMPERLDQVSVNLTGGVVTISWAAWEALL